MILLHIFTEELSIKILLDRILPKILSQDINYRIYTHQGKQDLEKALRTTIPAISRIPGSRIIVTRDQDSSDCKKIKYHIEQIFKSNCNCPYKVRIICNELESWFLGDLIAVEKAFSRFRSGRYKNKADFRNVDSIVKPSEPRVKIIPEYSAYRYLPKIEVAEKISGFIEIERNTSLSFKNFIKAVYELTNDVDN